MELGQIVVKTHGRFAGYLGVIKKIESNNIVVLGIPLNDNIVKEKRSNIKHVVPIPGKRIDEKSLNNDKDLIAAFKGLGYVPGEKIRV